MSSSTKSDLCTRTILFCLFIFVIPFINIFERSLGHAHAPFIGSLAGLAQHGAGLFDETGCIIITVTAVMLILKAIHREYSRWIALSMSITAVTVIMMQPVSSKRPAPCCARPARLPMNGAWA